MSRNFVFALARFAHALAALLLVSACGAQITTNATPAPAASATPAPAASPAPRPTAAPAPTRAPEPTAAPPSPTVSGDPSANVSCLPRDVDLPMTPSPPAAATPAPPRRAPSAPSVLSYEIVNVYPHDRRAWTQGLLIEDGVLYEGTGREYGLAKLRRIDLESGTVLQGCELPADFYGEGVTIFGDKIIQLTWQSYVGFVYDKASFAFLRAFSYPTEGWGLTHDDTHLIMSDGTPTLHFLDPETLQETSRIEVYDDKGAVTQLNELEYIRGEIYANVWLTNRIARIDPRTGQVLAWIDLSGLLGPEDQAQPVAELNGIAYDAEQDRLFVTGKLWPKLFEIKLKPLSARHDVRIIGRG